MNTTYLSPVCSDADAEVCFANPAWATKIVCPECAHGLHQTGMEFTRDDDDYVGDSDGYKGRGEYCKITFVCENRHEARLVFGNHKGDLVLGLLGAAAIAKLPKVIVDLPRRVHDDNGL